MPRAFATLTIIAYLGALSWGVISHTLTLGNASHPVMYYLVWDMFCGWSGYETRQHLIAEGVSGSYYQLSPAPWGEFQPYGPAIRPDYDSFAVHSLAIAQNVLARTEHEPIRRIYVVEENWSKRYNRPNFVWKREFEEPKDLYSYYHTRVVYDGEGMLLERKYNWSTAIFERELSSDPRLAKIRQQNRPFFVASPTFGSTNTNMSAFPGTSFPGSPPEPVPFNPVRQTSFALPEPENFSP